MNQLGSRVLTTQRLILRPFRATDAEQAFSGWMSDPAVTKYLTWERHESIFLSRQLLAAWEQEAKLLTTYHWAIVWRETGVVIGDISVPTADMRSQWAEVAYCLSRAFWGRGIMTEALMAVIDFLIGKVGFLRIEAKHATENIASGRVMEKCGMQLEGVLRKGHRLLSTGELVDIAIRAILREEWEARKALQWCILPPFAINYAASKTTLLRSGTQFVAYDLSR